MNNHEDGITDSADQNEKDFESDPTETLLPKNTVSEISPIAPYSAEDDLKMSKYQLIKVTGEKPDAEELLGIDDTKKKLDCPTIEKSKSIKSDEPDNDDPHFTGSQLKPTTYLETFTHMVKGNIGVGMLAMGMAYKNGGILVSTILVLVIGSIAWYNQYTLVEMANEFHTNYNCGSLSFARTIQFAFKKGHPAFRKSANFLRFTIETCIIVTQLGFCTVYFIFVASSLKQLFDQYEIFISTSTFMTAVLPVFWITSLIRELKYIAPLSTLANFSMFASLALITVNNLQGLPSISERSLIGDWKTIPLCFGTVMYSVEGISLIMPLQQNMKKKEQFLGTCGVLNLSLGLVMFLLMMTGFLGYYKNGDEVAASLTFNLDSKNMITQIVVAALVLSVMCTYCLQFFVPIYLMMPWVRKRTSSWPFSNTSLYEYLLRSLLVILNYLVVLMVPHLDLLVSLMGAIGGTFLGLIFLPMADLSIRTRKKDGYKTWKVFFPILSLLVGTVGFLVGTTVSLKEMIIAVLNDHNNMEIS